MTAENEVPQVPPTPPQPAPALAPEAAPAVPGEAPNVGGLFGGAPAEEAPRMPTVLRGRIDRHGIAMGTGRRKTSVARVRLKAGGGQLTINGRALDDFFKTERNRNSVEAPLKATGRHGQVDVTVRVEGGGTTGQAGAIVLGIARALQALEPTLHAILADNGFLTRDSRMVERKKYGRRKARRSFQFSKR